MDAAALQEQGPDAEKKGWKQTAEARLCEELWNEAPRMRGPLGKCEQAQAEGEDKARRLASTESEPKS